MHITLEFETAEGLFVLEGPRAATPEELFERRWALTLIDRSLTRLRSEFARAGKADLFAALKDHLIGGAAGTPYAAVAEKMGMTEGAVKVTVHRMRRRFRELLRAEIGDTVATADEIDDEVRYLMSVVGS